MSRIETRLFINNQYVRSRSGATLTVRNPTDDSTITNDLQVAGEEDINTAVVAANVAFQTGPWSSFTGQQRGKCLFRLADLIEGDADSLLQLETMAMGVPKAGVEFMMPLVSKYLRYYAGYADKISGESYPAEDGIYKIVTYEPLGVCASIASFNATFLYVALKLGPALAAGNTCIFKASEKAPFGALALGRLVCKAGFPPGVINFISGGAQTGKLLGSHMGIAHINFTGSVTAGCKVQEAAAKSNLKRCVLELGGKSAAIVFNDAHIATALACCSFGFLANTGQVCVATSRVYVQDDIASTFIEALRCQFEEARTRVGDPKSSSTLFGPLADKDQMNRVLAYIEDGKIEADLICGGNRIGDEGCFVEPTIFLNPNPGSKVYTEEIFGPVLVVKTFQTEKEAISLANDTQFGLSEASIYTQDISRALRVSGLLKTGTVGINKNFSPEVETPFGGVKASGSGRESGKAGLMEYLEPKTIHISI
ncbi:unnamed protein product [Penicillium crustosum]